MARIFRSKPKQFASVVTIRRLLCQVNGSGTRSENKHKHTHTMDLAASDCKIINLVRNLIGCQIMMRHTARASFARLNLYAKFVSWHLEFHHFFQLNLDRTQSTFFKFLHFRQSLDNYFIISHSLCTTNLNNCFDKNVV